MIFENEASAANETLLKHFFVVAKIVSLAVFKQLAKKLVNNKTKTTAIIWVKITISSLLFVFLRVYFTGQKKNPRKRKKKEKLIKNSGGWPHEGAKNWPQNQDYTHMKGNFIVLSKKKGVGKAWIGPFFYKIS